MVTDDDRRVLLEERIKIQERKVKALRLAYLNAREMRDAAIGDLHALRLELHRLKAATSPERNGNKQRVRDAKWSRKNATGYT
jgi:hypothetical protein